MKYQTARRCYGALVRAVWADLCPSA